MLNNGMFSCAMMAPLSQKLKLGKPGMHEQMARLYEAAEELCGVVGQSAVARLLNVSPQRLGNWEDRGMSSEGMLDAQEIIGCNAVWIRKGIGPMRVGEPVPVPSERPRDALAEALRLTTETAAELQMLTVYRLSNQPNRATIDIAVDAAREALSIATVLNKH
jgi:hypothetical protein